MKRTVIVDTGILVAYLNREEKYDAWTKEQFSKLTPPLLSCEAVIAESCFLLSKVHDGVEKLFELLATRQILFPFRFETEIENIQALMLRYRNAPISFADACLVRMSEQFANSEVTTLDHDFKIYRKNRRQMIPLIMPS